MPVAQAPIEAEIVRVWYESMVHAGDQDPVEFNEIVKEWVKQERYSFCQDNVLWQNMKNVNRLIDGEADREVFNAWRRYNQLYNLPTTDFSDLIA